MPILAHKIRLYPNNKQKTMLAKSCGASRFAYNWALAEWKRQYDNGEKPNETKLRRDLNAIKKEQFPWMYEVSKCCVQQAVKDLGIAFNRFFKGFARYPKFKRKFVNDSFYLDNLNFRLRDDRIHLARIGEIRLGEKLRFEGKLMAATISREASQWYISIQVEISDIAPLQKTSKTVGIDVGVRQYADSNGNFYDVPRSYRTSERRLRRLQQSLSRKQKGSRNRHKARGKVSRCHLRVKNIRQDWLHKLTSEIIRNNDVIGIEDLNVKGMVRNKHLAKSITDACFGEFRRQIEYKSLLYGRRVVIVPRFYPSSKLCNRCGTKTKSIPLSIREWTCEKCGTEHHRDTNAAINVKVYAESSPVSACGEFSASVDATHSSKDKQPQRSRKKTANSTVRRNV
jgi:putative transposase